MSVYSNHRFPVVCAVRGFAQRVLVGIVVVADPNGDAVAALCKPLLLKIVANNIERTQIVLRIRVYDDPRLFIIYCTDPPLVTSRLPIKRILWQISTAERPV